MRVEDLHHEEFLELDPEGGVIRFAGQRALLLDAMAVGFLRKYLVENFGLTAAPAVLFDEVLDHPLLVAVDPTREEGTSPRAPPSPRQAAYKGAAIYAKTPERTDARSRSAALCPGCHPDAKAQMYIILIESRSRAVPSINVTN